MRFSLRSILIVLTLVALDLGAWQVSRGWGLLANFLLLGAFLVWLIGPSKLAKLEGAIATERKLRLVGRRVINETMLIHHGGAEDTEK